MKHNKKRITKIIDELVTYLFSMGATDININIYDRAEDCKISIKSNYIDNKKEKLDKLTRALKSQKKEEMEEYFWELTGESDVDTELYLVGMMLDRAEVNIDHNMLELNLYRNK